jgi:hypothetical protein
VTLAKTISEMTRASRVSFRKKLAQERAEAAARAAQPEGPTFIDRDRPYRNRRQDTAEGTGSDPFER